jgi:hypothetical protein
MDDDLNEMSSEALIEMVKRLRAGIRKHRDSSGHDLCWFHPQLWALLPEPVAQTSRYRHGQNSCAAAWRFAKASTRSCPALR